MAVGRAGGEAHPAVAHDNGRNAVKRGGREVGVPGHLTIEVSVYVDEARSHEMPGRVDLLASCCRHFSDRDNALAIDRNVADAPFRTGAVMNGSATDHQIVHGSLPSRPCPILDSGAAALLRSSAPTGGDRL